MKYLVDTDYVISYLKGKRKAVELLQKNKEKLAVSVISLAEILEGIYGQAEQEKRTSELKDFLTGVKLLDIDKNVAEDFARIRARLRKKSEILESLDILISATARTYNLILITGNKQHFGRVEGLKIL